jgi:hypothetical protein
MGEPVVTSVKGLSITANETISDPSCSMLLFPEVSYSLRIAEAMLLSTIAPSKTTSLTSLRSMGRLYVAFNKPFTVNHT